MKNRFTKPVDSNCCITGRKHDAAWPGLKRSLLLVLFIIATLALLSLSGCKTSDADQHPPAGGNSAGEEILSESTDGNKTQDPSGKNQIDDSKKSGIGSDDSAVSEDGTHPSSQAGNGGPVPKDKTDAAGDSESLTCTISISCATILDNRDLLSDAKQGLVPADGWILRETSASFEEGESAFDVLLRICRQHKIHMEHSNVPLYNSAYIEGIHNLYEFDCGPLSGWVYSVDGFFPNYGSSRYALKDGQVLRWMYSCDLGEDVGGWNY